MDNAWNNTINETVYHAGIEIKIKYLCRPNNKNTESNDKHTTFLPISIIKYA